MNITRRGLLFGVGALAATAVVPRELVPLPETDMQRLMRMARTQRIIQDQTFLIDGPVVLDGFNDVLITRCIFVMYARPKNQHVIQMGGNETSGLRVFNCHFYDMPAYKRRDQEGHYLMVPNQRVRFP